jgi:hypothetical protein
MAYRIHDSITSGELDFRIKGTITGHLDLVGTEVPIHLDLQGFPNPDLAGLLMRFQHPEANCPLPHPLHPNQEGRAGDLTASRKHPILDCPIEEAWDLGMLGLPVPEHMANVLYLEWFSPHNGRVVVEIPEAEIAIEGVPTWRMTAEEERQQQQNMSDALTEFMQLLEENFEEDPPTDEDI